MQVHFKFAADSESIDVAVPFSDLVLHMQDRCRFALRPKPDRDAVDPHPLSWVNFGSSVMGSLYMAVDYDSNTMWIAQARHEEAPAVGEGKSEL